MSAVLERVITEQQKEIDRLRLLERHIFETWQREHKRMESLAITIFGVLTYPDNLECRSQLKKAIMDMGFCPACECRPCECGDQD